MAHCLDKPYHVKSLFDEDAPSYECFCDKCMVNRKLDAAKASYKTDPRLIQMFAKPKKTKRDNAFKEKYSTFESFIMQYKFLFDLHQIFMLNKQEIKQQNCIFVIEKKTIININNFNLPKSQILVISPHKYNHQKHYQLIPINTCKTTFYVKDYAVEDHVQEHHLNKVSVEAFRLATLCTDYILIDNIYKYYQSGNLQVDFQKILKSNKKMVYLEAQYNRPTCAWIKLCTQKSYDKPYIQCMVNRTEQEIKPSSMRFKPY